MPGKPFSTKQKKEQLQKKREKKRTTKGISFLLETYSIQIFPIQMVLVFLILPFFKAELTCAFFRWQFLLPLKIIFENL